jgi:hypothetical protein
MSVIKYKVTDEVINNPEFKLDGDSYIYNINKLSKLINEFTGISLNKLNYFIRVFGIKLIFDDPYMMGVDDGQAELIFELKELLNIKEAYVYGTNTNESI